MGKEGWAIRAQVRRAALDGIAMNATKCMPFSGHGLALAARPGAIWPSELSMNSRLMKTIGCALVLTASSLAQSAQQRAEGKVSTLLALERMWNQGQLSRDAAALQLLLGENFIDTEWDGSVSNSEQFLADIRNPKFKPSVVANRDVRVDLYGTAAVVTGTYHAKGTFQGKPYDHVGRFTDVWIFANGSWRCAASHTSLLK
jgi:hypothetical protein